MILHPGSFFMRHHARRRERWDEALPRQQAGLRCLRTQGALLPERISLGVDCCVEARRQSEMGPRNGGERSGEDVQRDRERQERAPEGRRRVGEPWASNGASSDLELLRNLPITAT